MGLRGGKGVWNLKVAGTITLMSLIVGVHISVLAQNLPKMTILRDKLKDFDKTTRDEAMK